MELHCPHCRNSINLHETQTEADIVCPACGSTFRLEDVGTTGWMPAQKFGKFEVIEVVGHGAFGTVYKARDPELERVVALKVPRSGNLAGPGELKRFLREARSVARLRHPSIVSVHEVGTNESVPFLVSDFVEGVTLADWLSAHRPKFAEAAELIARLADALHYAHENGVVHRDVKPSNVMLERVSAGASSGEWSKHDAALTQYSLRLMDFGLAKRDAGEISMTLEGQVLGTPAYMSPEQARGEAHAADRRSDLYSLGVIFYQLLTGELPFRGTPRMLLHQVMHDEPRRPRSLNDHIPRDLETICLKLTAKEPGRRYQTAKDLADEVHRYQNGQPIKARPISGAERAWRWARQRPAVAGLLALLILVLGISLPGLTTLWLQASASRRDVEKERDVVAKAKDRAEKDREAARRHLYGAQASLIQMAWRDRQVGRVQQLLDLQTPKDNDPDERGFEWHYFRRLVEESQITLAGHTDTVTALAFSADRRYLASGSLDGTAKLWELGTRRELFNFPGHTGGVVGLALGPDTRRMAVVDRNGTVRVWQIAPAKEVFSLPKRNTGPSCVAFSPDGRLLAVAGRDQATLHDDTGKEVRSFKGHGKAVTAVTFSADSQSVVSAGADGTVRVWDAGTGKELHLLRVEDPVLQLDVMADGQGVIVTAVSGSLTVWRPEIGETNSWLFRGNVTALSRDGRQLAYLAQADEARVVDPDSGREVFALRRHADLITRIAFSADGGRIATASKDRTVKVWTGGFFQLDVQELSGHAGEVFAVVYSPDGKQLASGGADGTVQVRDSTTGNELFRVRGHARVQSGTIATDQANHVVQGATALAYSADSDRLASGGADGTIGIWEARTGKALNTIGAHGTAATGVSFKSNARNTVTGVAFSPDGRLLASSSWDKTVKLWDATTGKLLHTFSGHAREATRVAFSPDGKLLASSSWDQTIRLWDPATGAAVRALRWVSRPGHVDPIDSLAFHPGGKYLAAAPDQFGPGGEVKVFDLTDGSEVHSLPGHLYGIFQVVYSADGRRLASCSCDGGLKVWDTATGQELFAYHNYTGLPPGSDGPIDTRRDAIHSVALSPDGLHLALGCRNSSVLVLDAAPRTPESLAAREASRLVRSLYESEVTRSAVLEHLAADSMLSPALRDDARARAKLYRQDPGLLNGTSWRVVSRPGQPKAAYERALLQIQEACRLAPGNGELLNTLGVAEYRAGRYQAALATLTASDKIQSARLKGSHPADVAFLAMAQQQLGHNEQARDVLGRLRELMKGRWAGNAEARGFLQEAEGLIQTPGK